MKPLSGLWLYINLGLAVIWDLVGFVLLIINFIPVVQVISLVGSFVLDIAATMTDLIFSLLYRGYVVIYSVNMKVYQGAQIASVLRLARRSQNTSPQGNRVQQALAKKSQQISKDMLGQFAKYVQSFAVKRITTLLIAITVEAIPVIGDLSPSWTVKAWVHVREHRIKARKLKEDNQQFEDSINKWRQSLSIPGVVNNIRGLNRSQNSQPVSTGTNR